MWLFLPPLLALTFFGVSYKVAVDSMLIPLTRQTLCAGLGALLGLCARTGWCYIR
ncbi:MAG: hypothetical protein U0401_09595 [Anaerolineae bacterium]